MKYTEENILHSASGYCMPFEEPSKEVELSLGYGEQKHPVTGESFFHHGIDFNVSHYLLSAVADGTVSAVGSEVRHGICQTVRYGKYEVTYAHLSNVIANFGQPVKAGQPIAVSGDMLHMEVRFDGEELNPIEFLTMLYANVKAMQQEELLYYLADLFKVLGDSTRIRILCVLYNGELCVNDIAEKLSMTTSAISHQLRTLKQSRLVKFRREGKTIFYALDDDHIFSILRQGMEHIQE